MIVATYNKTENKMKLRKFAAMILVICIVAITLAAGCKSKAVSYTVTFDSGGGTAVAAHPQTPKRIILRLRAGLQKTMKSTCLPRPLLPI